MSEINAFQKLKILLNSIAGTTESSCQQGDAEGLSFVDLRDIDSMTFLSPFLEIIRSDETSGPLTCLALNAVNKFLCYGLIGKHTSTLLVECLVFLSRLEDHLSDTSAATIDQVANAVTHTRFVGTNANDDEVVLMRILQVTIKGKPEREREICNCSSKGSSLVVTQSRRVDLDQRQRL